MLFHEIINKLGDIVFYNLLSFIVNFVLVGFLIYVLVVLILFCACKIIELLTEISGMFSYFKPSNKRNLSDDSKSSDDHSSDDA